MKLDKFRFARVVAFVCNRGAVLDDNGIEFLDGLIENHATAEPVGLTYEFVKQHIDNIFEALIEGRKIDAIRAHRAITALGLKDSKDVIEQFAREYRKHIAREIAGSLDEAGHNNAAELLRGSI